MSVHLVGGGWQDEPDGAAYAAFIAEAARRAAASGRDVPRIAVVAVRDGDAAEHAAKLVHAASAAGEFEPHVTAVDHDGSVPATAFAEVDGILVGGGLTPVYRELLEPHFGELRRQVASGVPYAGFSAGAAIAAERALVGGWRIGGVPVSPEDASEDLDELTVAPGIGLVDVSVDVHVAQWGTLSRLVAAVEAGLVEGGLGIDELTALIVGQGGLRVAGHGSVWRVLPAESGVLVSTIGA
ncbi:Type 1 glutamine amidotransferase-like domain-containing protein [Agromyces bauzanensis]